MKVWFYYANAGGGHRGPALALARELEKKGVEPVLVDCAEGSWSGFGWVLEKGYAFIVQAFPRVYGVLYQLATFKPVRFLMHWWSSVLIKSRIEKRFLKEKPDAVVATYFFIKPLVDILKKKHIDVPVFVVVTDPHTAPPIWFDFPSVEYVVFSEAVKQTALYQGVPVEKVRVFSPLVNSRPPEDFDAYAQDVLKTKLGLERQKKTVLVVGGGGGFPKGAAIVRELNRAAIDAQVVVVCGKDAQFKEEMEVLKKEATVPVYVFGFVDFLPSLIALADVVVSKAGAGIVGEVLEQKKPLIIAHYIEGQETGNKDFVVASQVGWYEPDVERVPQLVEQCLQNYSVRETIEAAYARLGFKAGNDAVVEYLSGAFEAKK